MTVDIFTACREAEYDHVKGWSLTTLLDKIQPTGATATFALFFQVRFNPDELGLHSFTVRANDEDRGFKQVGSASTLVRAEDGDNPVYRKALYVTLDSKPVRELMIELIAVIEGGKDRIIASFQLSVVAAT